MVDVVRVVGAGDRTSPAQPTPGMRREEALSAEGFWLGLVTVDPGVTSGWHHHGKHDTYVYVLEGTLHLEFGPGGSGIADAQPDDFLHIPAGVVHREGAPDGAGMRAVVVRRGSGPITVNVDGPDSVSPPSAGGG
jgi:uncharacterized RmlC-like cupin family protein